MTRVTLIVRMRPIALTIAGSDPSGGAGIQADLKTFHQLGVYGTAAITLITVQNTVRVSRVEPLDPELVAGQIWAVLEDLPPRAAKTGALGTAEIVKSVAEAFVGTSFPLVVDPVMISKHGAPLMERDARDALRGLLLPRAAIVTPNLPEAAELAQMPVGNPAQMRAAAVRIAVFGSEAVLIKGGHLEGPALDIFYTHGVFTEFESPRFDTSHTHGTGCTYSAAITAYLALGASPVDSVRAAKRFITEAIRTVPGIGSGCGPVNHWATFEPPLL
jgi:hydroxymethylpyrimidine/phosphomethylpyrimidine kinase